MKSIEHIELTLSKVYRHYTTYKVTSHKGMIHLLKVEKLYKQMRGNLLNYIRRHKLGIDLSAQMRIKYKSVAQLYAPETHV